MSQNWTPPPAGGSATVPNYLVPAIISIFCCWPLAAAGDIAGAQDASKKAKMFSFIAIGLGAVLILCYVVFFLLLGIGGSMSR